MKVLSEITCLVCNHDPRRCSPSWCKCTACEDFTAYEEGLLEDKR